MKALVLEKYNEFVYKDADMPLVGERDVLIRIKACSVCGSDVHGMDGSTGRRIPPVIMGHEAAGTIEKCGGKVKNYKPGDRVTFDSTVYCGECDYCKNGDVNLCGNRRVLGVSCGDYRMDGAFAEYVAVPEHILYLLPENVTFLQACMVEPLSVGYHAVMRTPVSKDGVSVVFGAGTIGMLTLQVAKALGAKTVIAVDISQPRLDMALEKGADYAVNALDNDANEQIIKLTKDCEGADVCYDATGTSQTLNAGLRALKKGGRHVLIGNLDAKAEFPLQWVVTRQISLFGSCASAGEYGKCLDLIASGKVDVDSLISKVVPLSEGNQWIHKVYNREDGLTKIVVIP
ncbi:MAG: zinc-dependent alcohol dehydrogenase [Christensenellales bacterium]